MFDVLLEMISDVVNIIDVAGKIGIWVDWIDRA